MTALLDRPLPSSQSPAASTSAADAPSRWRQHAPMLAVTGVALTLNAWALSLNGVGNQYYAAASRGMTESWSNFFFASLDPGGFISIDKPPVFLWIDAISVRLFGYSSWSLLLPSALAGAAAVALLYRIIERHFGRVAATIAALVLALSPVNVAIDRLNLPEPFLILFLLATAWAVLRSLDARRPLHWLALAGLFVGLAFNTKMLAAYIPLPAVGIALLIGTVGWGERIKRAVVFGATALITSASWLVIVDLIPASSRPYVGGSTDNTVWDLVLGYNGFGRVTGGSAVGPGGGLGGGGFGGSPGTGMNGAGGIMGGTAGPFRLISDAIGGQIAWLLPLALVGLVAALWFHRQDRSRRAAVILWGGWLALYGVIFSKAAGTFHAYYVSVMTPAIAALVGIGVAALVMLARRNHLWFLALGGAAIATVEMQLVLAGRESTFYGWTRPVLVGLVLVAGAGVLIGLARHRGRTIVVALAIGLAGLLVAPTAWAISETANPVLNATLPQAGPRTGSSGSSFGSASSNGDAALAAYLVSRRTGETWDLVVTSAQAASGLIAVNDLDVMALGGFMGTDKAATVDSTADLVAAGELRFFLVSSSGPSGGTGGGAGGSSATRGGLGGGGFMGGGASGGTANGIMTAVQSACTAVTADAGTATDAATTTTGTAAVSLPTNYIGSLYDCAGKADALHAAG